MSPLELIIKVLFEATLFSQEDNVEVNAPGDLDLFNNVCDYNVADISYFGDLEIPDDFLLNNYWHADIHISTHSSSLSICLIRGLYVQMKTGKV